ncbi:DUF4044 domain-containing protein [Lactobacillus psittaci]|nr:DUF4044 domain-containing protein [Lactobacillus psittaci]
MARRKKSKFQKLTIFMAFLMALITLFGVVAVIFQYFVQF